jgi:hypothetical protein
MKKLFSASLLLISLTATALNAAYPPIPDPTELPPASTVSKRLAISTAYPPIPDPTELPPVSR